MPSWDKPKRCPCGEGGTLHYCRKCQRYVCHYCWVGPWRCAKCYEPKCAWCGCDITSRSQSFCAECKKEYDKIYKEVKASYRVP